MIYRLGKKAPVFTTASLYSSFQIRHTPRAPRPGGGDRAKGALPYCA
jgi:hypothetical protein